MPSLGQFSQLGNQLSLPQGGRGVCLQPEAPRRPPGSPQVSHQASPTSVPPSAQLLTLMMRGTVMPVPCIVDAFLCGQGVPAPH